MCYDELAPCTAHEEQSNGWYGMASKQGTNSPRGEQIHGLEKNCAQGICSAKFPRNKFTREQIPSYTGTNPRTSTSVFFPERITGHRKTSAIEIFSGKFQRPENFYSKYFCWYTAYRRPKVKNSYRGSGES